MELHPEIEKAINLRARQRSPPKFNDIRVDEDDIEEFAKAVSYRGISYDSDTDEAVIEVKAPSDFKFRVNLGHPIETVGDIGESFGKGFGAGAGAMKGSAMGASTGAAIGVLGGPLGMMAGMAVGSAIGGFLGARKGQKWGGAIGKLGGQAVGVISRFDRQFKISAKEVFEREAGYREDTFHDCVYCHVTDTTMWWMEHLYSGTVTEVDKLTRGLHHLDSYHRGTVSTAGLRSHLTSGDNAMSKDSADALLNAIDSEKSGRIDCRVFAQVVHALANSSDDDDD